jgi:hypothetical protein
MAINPLALEAGYWVFSSAAPWPFPHERKRAELSGSDPLRHQALLEIAHLEQWFSLGDCRSALGDLWL